MALSSGNAGGADIRRWAGWAAAAACMVLLYGDWIYWSVARRIVPPTLANARTWCYQLVGLDPSALSAAECDVLAVYPLDGARRPLDADDLRTLRRGPGGRPRLILAYLSVGEAEAYRAYWKPEWMESPPWWLAERNPAWRSAYRVRYWAPEWRALLFGSDSAMVQQIAKAGFDGLFLDTVDVFSVMEPERPNAQRLMAELVIDLAAAARRIRPDLLVVPQNGEELLAEPGYLGAIDGQAKEDLFYGVDADGVRNRNQDIDHTLPLLARVKASGKPVLVVEYLTEREVVASARAEIARHGFVPTFAQRLLDRDPQSLIRDQSQP